MNISRLIIALWACLSSTYALQAQQVVIRERIRTTGHSTSSVSHEEAVALYGYPIKVHTGNPEADEHSYRLAKQKWIEQNPDLYARMKAQAYTSPKMMSAKRRKTAIINNQYKED